MSNREQFEAWWKSEGYDEKLSCVQGIMFNHIKANMFFAWQAATSAIEAKCAALAAENAKKSRCLGFFASVIKSGESWTRFCQHEYNEAQETPDTDAFLAEVRAQGVEMFAREMHADISEADAIEFAAQLRKGAAE